MLVAVLMQLGLATPGPLPEICFDEELGMSSTECLVARRERMWSRFSIAPIADEAAAGVKIMRAGIVDGVDRDLVAITFEARPDQSPAVVVEGYGGQRILHPLSAAVWDAALRSAVFADRELVPLRRIPEAGEGQDVMICFHSWTAHVEIANVPGSDERQGPVRQRSEDACDGAGLAFRYAFRLAELAVNAIPACAALEPGQHRNDASRLAACLMLRGNTLAAADLMNEKGEPPDGSRGDHPNADEWARWLSTDMTGRLEWAGEVVQESNVFRPGQPHSPRLSDVMTERMGALEGFTVYQSVFGARDADNGWITGQVAYWVGDANGDEQQMMVADYRQDWSRSDGGYWSMDNWVIGPFRILETSYY